MIDSNKREIRVESILTNTSAKFALNYDSVSVQTFIVGAVDFSGYLPVFWLAAKLQSIIDWVDSSTSRPFHIYDNITGWGLSLWQQNSIIRMGDWYEPSVAPEIYSGVVDVPKLLLREALSNYLEKCGIRVTELQNFRRLAGEQSAVLPRVSKLLFDSYLAEHPPTETPDNSVNLMLFGPQCATSRLKTNLNFDTRIAICFEETQKFVPYVFKEQIGTYRCFVSNYQNGFPISMIEDGERLVRAILSGRRVVDLIAIP